MGRNFRMGKIYLHSRSFFSISAFMWSNRPFSMLALSQCDATFGLQNIRMSIAMFAIDWQPKSSSSDKNNAMRLANSLHFS